MTKTVRFRHLLIAALLGGLVASALPAAAAQVGDAFGLGQSNSVNAETTLRGSVNTSNLTIRNTGSGVPLTLKNNSGGVPNGKPPLEVDSRRSVANLNADRVDFRHANELGRAAYDAIGDAADTNGALVQATVAAPKPGILIAGGSVAAFAPSVDNIRCRLTVASPTGASTVFTHREVTIGANSNGICGTTGGFNAYEAGTYTVDLYVDLRDTAEFNDATVWVIWVPFDGNGNVP